MVCHGLSGVTVLLVFACAFAIDVNPSETKNAVQVARRNVIDRRDSPNERSVELIHPAERFHQLARRYEQLTRRAFEVSGLKIPLIGDYFRFLRIPTFGQYYESLHLPYIPFLNIGKEPETDVNIDIGPINCKCKTRVCDCCIAAIGCANIQSIPNAIGANISVSAFGFPLFNTPIVLINKPSFCFTLFSFFGTPIQLCIDLYNINTLVVKNNFCVTLGLQKGTKREINLNIGCIGIGFDKMFSYKLAPNLNFIDIPVLGFSTPNK